MYKNNIIITRFYYINNPNNIFRRKYFLLSALNLSFLSFFYKKEIVLEKFLVLWPDGYFAKSFTKKKIPGSTLISKLNIPKFVKKIVVIGDLNKNEKLFLLKKFKILVIHHPMPNSCVKTLLNKIPKNLYSDALYLITLPTPKQEQIAYKMFKNNKKLKIICIGGGLAIAAGTIKKCPKILYNFNLEFLWRLRTDTLRRLKRLIFSFFNYYFYKSKSNIKISFQKI